MVDPNRKNKCVLKYHREWLSENGEEVYRKASGKLDHAISGNLKMRIKLLADEMFGLAAYFGSKSIVAAFDRLPQGSQEIHRAIQYQIWLNQP